ncbi:MAG: hypothetical protein JXM72_00325, partial [Deltaproteobacteria bacterium]|nr:hypothetical protein [Deltaproteobacteria bacterium]
VCKIKASGGTSETNVILLTGGYDTNQDNDDPGTADSKGRAVFAVDAGSGALVSNLKFYHGDGSTFSSYMNYCIVELVSYDDNSDDCDDVIYAGDLGGNLFVFNDKDADGAWVPRRLFDAGNDGGTQYLRKFTKAPGIAQETWGDYVYIGSGDREHPIETDTLNRFYAIKNTWPATYSNGSPITASDLVDVTNDYLQGSSTITAYTGTQYENHLASILSSGWYIDLKESDGSEIGEKVVSSPLVYSGVVYFTTFIPSSQSAAGQDPCTTSAGAGTARLWAVDYKTGNAVFESFDGDSSTLTREDRFKNIGGGIPSDPVLIVTPEGTFIGVGTQGSPKFDDTEETKSIERYYWMK